MPIPLQDIVNVQIDLQTGAVAVAAFDTPLVLGLHAEWTDRVRIYSNLTGFLEDFPASGDIYNAVRLIFSQSPSVSRVMVGRVTIDGRATYTGDLVSPVVAGEKIFATINGVSFTYVFPATPVKAAVLAAFAAGMQNALVTAGIVATVTYNVTADVIEVELNVAVSTTVLSWRAANDSVIENLLTGQQLGQEGWVSAISRVQAVNNTWYGLVAITKTKADVLSIAQYIETQSKVFGTSSALAENVNTPAVSDTVSIVAQLKALALIRTFFFYGGSVAGQEYMEAAFLGKLFTFDPGQATGAYKTLAGVTTVTLTTTQTTNLIAKNGNYYGQAGGRNITVDGRMVSGEWFDTIVFVDWLKTRTQERTFRLLSLLPKVPFTNSGITTITGEVWAVLQEGVEIGGLADDTPIEMTIPLVTATTANDRANRILRGIVVRARLAGAVHLVFVEMTITV